MPVRFTYGPSAEPTRAVFCLGDAYRDLAGVRLRQELVRPRSGPDFVWQEDPRGWTLDFPRGPVDRMEYLLELVHHDGGTELVPDPANPLRAPGPFGDRSVVEFPGYRPPAWLDRTSLPEGPRRPFALRSRLLRRSLAVEIWAAAGTQADEPLPLLIVHDGPDYAAYSDLPLLLDGLTADGTLPPLRAALLPAVERDELYAASPLYARALAHELLPALNQVAPAPDDRSGWVGMGASLGGLAMLHAHRLNPGLFGGLFLQSPSLFHLYSDRHESAFPQFRRIRDFVQRTLAGREGRDPIRVVMTCGTVEENLVNNRAVTRALRGQGYAAELHEVRDAHNWVAWRDAFDPYLVDLLRGLWTPAAAAEGEG